MHFSSTSKPADGSISNTGFAYVALLLFVSLAATLGLAFVQSVGMDSATKASRMETLQAEYLARAAVNHALFLIDEDSKYPKFASRYYMFDAPSGRYGSRIRRKDGQYVSIATVGIVGDTVVRQSYLVRMR